MKTIEYSLLFVLTLMASAGANAAGSMLRVTCEAKHEGADVIVNGTFRGNCPVDISVQEGNVRLMLRLKEAERVGVTPDARAEQVFKTELRIGEGTIKKVEVPEAGWKYKFTDDALLLRGKSFGATLKAAKMGDVEAMGYLVSLYRDGAGVPENFNEEMIWETKAAEAGAIASMEVLACRFAKGDRVPKDVEAANFWTRKAIDAAAKVGWDPMFAKQCMREALGK